MISLRKYIDNYRQDAKEPGAAALPLPESVLSEFRAMLVAIGQSAHRAVPSLGIELNSKMTQLQYDLVQPLSIHLLTKTNDQARKELSQWADRALSHHQDVERDLRDIISVVSAAAASLSGRDERYAREIGDVTGRLSAIGEETDLVHIRRSIIESTRALKDWVARMAEENKASVDHLTAEVNEYRTRLQETERVSQTDPLTNLANRRAFEKHLEARIAARKPFCLIMVDLDDFKLVNDRFGHIAGDDLLMQFALELKSQFTPGEMVARWGGDEFVVVIAGHLVGAHARVERVRKWSLGEYKITHGGQIVKTLLNAAVGVAEWDGKETGLRLLARADQQVYQGKNLAATHSH